MLRSMKDVELKLIFRPLRPIQPSLFQKNISSISAVFSGYIIPVYSFHFHSSHNISDLPEGP